MSFHHIDAGSTDGLCSVASLRRALDAAKSCINVVAVFESDFTSPRQLEAKYGTRGYALKCGPPGVIDAFNKIAIDKHGMVLDQWVAEVFGQLDDVVSSQDAWRNEVRKLSPDMIEYFNSLIHNPEQLSDEARKCGVQQSDLLMTAKMVCTAKDTRTRHTCDTDDFLLGVVDTADACLLEFQSAFTREVKDALMLSPLPEPALIAGMALNATTWHELSYVLLNWLTQLIRQYRESCIETALSALVQFNCERLTAALEFEYIAAIRLLQRPVDLRFDSFDESPTQTPVDLAVGQCTGDSRGGAPKKWAKLLEICLKLFPDALEVTLSEEQCDAVLREYRKHWQKRPVPKEIATRKFTHWPEATVDGISNALKAEKKRRKTRNFAEARLQNAE